MSESTTFDIKSLLMKTVNDIDDTKMNPIDKFIEKINRHEERSMIDNQCLYFNKLCVGMNDEERLFLFQHIKCWCGKNMIVLALPNCVPMLIKIRYQSYPLCYLFYVKNGKAIKYKCQNADIGVNCFMSFKKAVEAGKELYERDKEWFIKHGYHTAFVKSNIL